MSQYDDEEFYVDGDVDLTEGGYAYADETHGEIELPPVAADEQGDVQNRSNQFARRSGRQSNPGTLLYFDLETIPDYSRLESFGLEPLPEVPDETDSSSLPDPAMLVIGTVPDVEAKLRGVIASAEYAEKVTAAETAGKNRDGVHKAIKAAVQRRQDAIDAKADRCKLLSTTPEYLSIAAMGWAVGDGEVQSLVVGQNAEEQGIQGIVDERLILSMFWQFAAQAGQVVGFNCIKFDLPAIFVRSALLGIAPSRTIDLSPHSSNKDVCDLLLRRFGPNGNTNKGKPGKLKQLCPLYGIPVPAEGVDGGQVEELMRTNPALVDTYVRSDIQITRALHQALRGYFWQ